MFPEEASNQVNAGEMLTTVATSYPDRVAWIWDEGSRTYGATNSRADALARALQAFGLERGARVALSMHNCQLVAARRPRLKTVEQVIQLGGELQEKHLDFEALVGTSAGRPFVSVDVEDDELAWLAYTSG